MPPLTPKLKTLGECLLRGLSNPEIAREMRRSEDHVKQALHTLLDLSGMDDRVGLALWLHEKRGVLGISCPCDWGAEPVKLRVSA